MIEKPEGVLAKKSPEAGYKHGHHGQADHNEECQNAGRGPVSTICQAKCAHDYKGDQHKNDRRHFNFTIHNTFQTKSRMVRIPRPTRAITTQIPIGTSDSIIFEFSAFICSYSTPQMIAMYLKFLLVFGQEGARIRPGPLGQTFPHLRGGVKTRWSRQRRLQPGWSTGDRLSAIPANQ